MQRRKSGKNWMRRTYLTVKPNMMVQLCMNLVAIQNGLQGKRKIHNITGILGFTVR